MMFSTLQNEAIIVDKINEITNIDLFLKTARRECYTNYLQSPTENLSSKT